MQRLQSVVPQGGTRRPMLRLRRSHDRQRPHWLRLQLQGGDPYLILSNPFRENFHRSLQDLLRLVSVCQASRYMPCSSSLSLEFLMALPEPPTAVVAASDTEAIDRLLAARRRRAARCRDRPGRLLADHRSPDGVAGAPYVRRISSQPGYRRLPTSSRSASATTGAVSSWPRRSAASGRSEPTSFSARSSWSGRKRIRMQTRRFARQHDASACLTMPRNSRSSSHERISLG